MKKLYVLFCLFISAQLFPEEIRVIWQPNTEPDLAGYIIYHSTNYFSGDFTKIDVGNVDIATITNKYSVVNSYYLTAYNTSGLESDPSNQIRFEHLPVNRLITNHFTIKGYSSFDGAILVKSTKHGVLEGYPPNIYYYCTNKYAYKDEFIYSIPVAGLDPITNYFILQILYPNTPPTISEIRLK